MTPPPHADDPVARELGLQSDDGRAARLQQIIEDCRGEFVDEPPASPTDRAIDRALLGLEEATTMLALALLVGDDDRLRHAAEESVRLLEGLHFELCRARGGA